MSTFELSGPNFGKKSIDQAEQFNILAYDDIVNDKIPVDEIKLGMISPQLLLKFLEELKFHLINNIEDIAFEGLYNETEIEKMYQRLDSRIEDLDSTNLEDLTEDQLIALIQKARSAYKELQELKRGDRTPLERMELNNRINAYVYSKEDQKHKK